MWGGVIGFFFSWKTGAGQSNQLLEIGDSMETFYEWQKSFLMLPLLATTLLEKNAKDLATPFCFSTSHVSACQHGDTSSAPEASDTSIDEVPPPAVTPEAPVTGRGTAQATSSRNLFCNTEEVSLVISTCSARTSRFPNQEYLILSTSRMGLQGSRHCCPAPTYL